MIENLYNDESCRIVSSEKYLVGRLGWNIYYMGWVGSGQEI